jgi:hypothetical protein
MAKGFTATLDVKCWKEHECNSCGTVYRYKFRRKKKGQGPTEDQAAAAATQAAIQALENQVEIRPCPSCGLVQPDMVGTWRARGHLIVLLIALAGFIILFLFAAADGIPKNVGLWLAMAWGGLILLAHLFVALRPFNSNLRANCERAQYDIEDGKVQIAKGGTDYAEETAGLFRQGGGFLLFLFMLVGIAVMPTAEVMRRAMAWPWNPAWHPAVAGPLDQTWTWFPQTINTVKGLWYGTASATVVNDKELGLPNNGVQAETSTATWGNTISVKAGERHQTTSLWARIIVPALPNPQGKTMRVHIKLQVTYPTMRGNDKFDVVQNTVDHTETLVLATPGAGRTFILLWLVGGMGGACLVLAAGLILFFRARQLKSRARPTRVYPLGAGGGNVAPVDLVAATPVQVTSSDPTSQYKQLDLAELGRRGNRSRWWFYFFLIMMPVGCLSPISLIFMINNKGVQGGLVAGGILLFIVAFAGFLLMWNDKRRYDRLLREKQAKLQQTWPQERRGEAEDNEDEPRRPRCADPDERYS